MSGFDWPVGTPEERAAATYDWPGSWIDATGFGTLYGATGKNCYHTGADLNNNKPKFDSDAHAPVYAIADGVVVFAGSLPVWGVVVVVRHPFGNSAVWSRYAHVEALRVKQGDSVAKGQHLANISNAAGRYPYHLHFDIALIDLGASPGDWPGMQRNRLMRDYLNPVAFLRLMRQ